MHRREAMADLALATRLGAAQPLTPRAAWPAACSASSSLAFPRKPRTACSRSELLDRPGTLRFLASVKVNGVRPVSRPVGVRLRDLEAAGPMALEIHLVSPPGTLAAPEKEIQWVDTPAALRVVGEQLLGAEVIGLDVETALDFGTLCLIQIATRGRTYLIDPFGVGDLRPLARILSEMPPQKIIHNARFEHRVLAAVGLVVEGVFDTLEASRRVRGVDVLGGHSLAMVCERELGLSLDKSSQTSNWSRRPLDVDQLRYAALDAEILLRLHEHFGRMQSASEAQGSSEAKATRQ